MAIKFAFIFQLTIVRCAGNDCKQGTTPGVITELDLVISIPVNPGSDLNPARDLTIDGNLVDGEVGNSNYEYP